MANVGMISSSAPQVYPAFRALDFVPDSTAPTSVAMNGSVGPNGAAMARAAENVARWKTYLAEECVTAMMNAGWHWST